LTLLDIIIIIIITNDAVVKRAGLVCVGTLERDEMKDSIHRIVRSHHTNEPASSSQLGGSIQSQHFQSRDLTKKLTVSKLIIVCLTTTFFSGTHVTLLGEESTHFRKWQQRLPKRQTNNNKV